MRSYTIILAVAFALLQNAIAFPGSNQKTTVSLVTFCTPDSETLLSSSAPDLSCAAIYVSRGRNAQRSALIADTLSSGDTSFMAVTIPMAFTRPKKKSRNA
ncbi:hypothetical protein Pst134EA_021436 [Puccinia striiformis f. sp. tritici]|uniref:hypothetical protein n=1 Tax=Puccinia striiformis f. sp. tritici TaxID=168172 RepID=UPI00200742E6|nr:hypothetical protein Pst134EA_021436 [Puccinia striiformis f. sp. tritici]KAH9448321.1 hypothetical protein Pst134EB_022306 [Puccinia striiformis f. sp. tritici]KAH9457563.1 hypothetical protein Pst134EA_021436 [Puccinia striiformis f. sp. tritici]